MWLGNKWLIHNTRTEKRCTGLPSTMGPDKDWKALWRGIGQLRREVGKVEGVYFLAALK